MHVIGPPDYVWQRKPYRQSAVAPIAALMCARRDDVLCVQRRQPCVAFARRIGMTADVHAAGRAQHAVLYAGSLRSSLDIGWHAE